MMVTGHSGDKRRAALDRRMEIDFTESVRQVSDQPEDTLLHHAPAPSEAEHLIVDVQPGALQATPQCRDPEVVCRGPGALIRQGTAQHCRRFVWNAHRFHPKVSTDLDDQSGDGWMKVHVLVGIDVVEGQTSRSKGGELGSNFRLELAANSRQQEKSDPRSGQISVERRIVENEPGDLDTW